MFVIKKGFRAKTNNKINELTNKIGRLENEVMRLNENFSHLERCTINEIISGRIDTEDFIDQVVERIKRKQVK